MTLVSVSIAGLLAVRVPTFDLVLFLLAAVGSVIAHAANNMINDYFDLEEGLDTKDYPRSEYAPHPVLSGLVTRQGLLRAILFANALDAMIMIVLFIQRGWPIIAFALAGLFVSVFYVAPPLRLKARGLGEPSVFLIWGPIMVGGTYYAAVGSLPTEVLLASIPYALLVMTVLMGKHIDKEPWDRNEGIRTLPVVLGEDSARRFTAVLLVLFYVATALLVLTAFLPVWSLLTFLAIPRLTKTLQTYSKPKPDSPPARYPIWPLWFGPSAFVHSRRAGTMFVLGLFIAVLFPVTL
jgi:1,4-dihydroxy-2-naphthoate polyprenyltransferase